MNILNKYSLLALMITIIFTSGIFYSKVLANEEKIDKADIAISEVEDLTVHIDKVVIRLETNQEHMLRNLDEIKSLIRGSN